METDEVLCTSCGYNRLTGKSLSTVKAAPAGKRKMPWGSGKKNTAPADGPESMGSFLIGLLLASALGIIWVFLWVRVTHLIGYFISIPVAAFLGWTIGMGMRLGQRGYSQRGGVAAAIISVISIAGFNLVAFFVGMMITHGTYIAAILFIVFPGLTIISVAVGIGAAYRTANGPS